MKLTRLNDSHIIDLDLFCEIDPKAASLCQKYIKAKKFNIIPLNNTGQFMLAKRIYTMAWQPKNFQFISTQKKKTEISFLSVFHECVHHVFYSQFKNNYENLPEIILLAEAFATAADAHLMASISFFHGNTPHQFFNNYMKLDSYPVVKKRFLEIFKAHKTNKKKSFEMIVDDVLSAYYYCWHHMYTAPAGQTMTLGSALNKMSKQKWLWVLQSFNLTANLLFFSFGHSNDKLMNPKKWKEIQFLKKKILSRMDDIGDVFHAVSD